MTAEQMTVRRMPVDQVSEHPRNARRGDVALIAESLEAHGQYAPIVVQASTGHVVKGNHTLRAVRELGWAEIDAVFIDVDDETAARIMLMDNRSSDAGGYDDRDLADLLESLSDLGGTGYSDDDLAGQRRRRVFIVGVRDDLGADPPFPVPLRYRYSMLDACPWFAGWDHEDNGNHGFTHRVTQTGHLVRRGHGWYPGGEVGADEPAPTVTAMGGDTWGRLRITTPEVDRARFRRRGSHQPTDKHGPAPCVQARGIDGRAFDQAVLTDGTESRKLTIAEVKRLCSFPDDYEIGSTYAQQWARLGNSVPPLMARAVAEALAPVLLGER